MKRLFGFCGAFSALLVAGSAFGANALRGNQALVNAYKANQRNNYYMVNVPDVDSACREKVNKCLVDYCGDTTLVVGQTSRCAQNLVTESELYNYALLCLQKDTTTLLPNYNTNTRGGAGGLNTAAHLCPKYVQQEVMSYLSMAKMADQLSKSHSPQCLKRRSELEAAMSCHQIALAYGNETTSMLTSQLNDYCGPGVDGGSTEMVSRFANAGNVGANLWGWAEKIVSLDLNKKGENWQAAVDSVLASYTNRMNLACGENLQVNTVSYSTNQTSGLQTAITIGTALAFPETQKKTDASVELFKEVKLYSNVYDYDSARAVLDAAMAHSALTQNAFLTSAQMDDMQKAYKKGTKVFILRDDARCYIFPVVELSDAETSMMAQQFYGCIYK